MSFISMSYSDQRVVTVASVRLTAEESALISAYAKLAGTKVEAIVSDLTKYFIKQHVNLHLVHPPSDGEITELVTSFVQQTSDTE